MPAIPARPADRGATNDAFCHFVPTNFSTAVLDLVVKQPAAIASVVAQVSASAPLVHGRPVVHPKGVVVPLVNWGPTASLSNLSVHLNVPGVVTHGLHASLATGGGVKEIAPSTYQVDRLEVADALILRK